MQIEPRLILGGSFIMSHQCFNSFAIVNPREIKVKGKSKLGKDFKFTIKSKHSSKHETSKMTLELDGK
ncbi:hypothetical protein P8452_60927 [Trifolium repens]|nr:hypothetical protein P8452_60927 [Trifolium repens]